MKATTPHFQRPEEKVCTNTLYVMPIDVYIRLALHQKAWKSMMEGFQI